MPAAPSGHAFRVERERGPVWYAKYRMPAGRQVHKKLGPAWNKRRRPAAGYFAKRLAEDWLRDVLHEARHGAWPVRYVLGATFEDAAAEWLRYIGYDRGRTPSTVAGYKVMVRSMLLPAFGELQLETHDADDRALDRFDRSLRQHPHQRDRVAPRDLPPSQEGVAPSVNPVTDVEVCIDRAAHASIRCRPIRASRPGNRSAVGECDA